MEHIQELDHILERPPYPLQPVGKCRTLGDAHPPFPPHGRIPLAGGPYSTCHRCQGAFPETVSEALGDVQYRNAVAGAVGDRYYISMQDSTGRASLFVLDMSRGLWMREDELQCSHMARLGDELYALSGNVLYALRGSDGTAEPFVPWMAETGILYYQYPDRKYVSRFSFRLRMEEGAEMSVYIMYDSDGVWHHQGSIRFKGTDSIVLPVRPRRCDHLRIRLVGRGEVRIFSLTKLLTQGSDV